MSWTVVWSILPFSLGWMRWNLFLAAIPLVLSLVLFRWAPQRSLFWWVGLVAFIAFLPNAPYILTDLIHLVEEIQRTDSLLLNTVVIIPRYVLFILLGFAAYVVALVNLNSYLHTLTAHSPSLRRWGLPVELGLHGLSAIGVYLGRCDRFNSWDLLAQPGTVLQSLIQTVSHGRSLGLIAIATLVIAGLYWLGKQITLALVFRYHSLNATSPKQVS